MTQTTAGATPALLVDRLGLSAGPAVWAYRDAVLAATDQVLEADHGLGLVQIGLRLPRKPELLIGWRIDHGWYLLRHPHPNEPPALGPTLYRGAIEVLDRLLPEPERVAAWLSPIAAGGYPTGTITAGQPILSRS
jgi:hypothetical protein